MKLDADRLRAEVEAHQARMESHLWTRSDGEAEEAWTAPLVGDAHSTEEPLSRAPAKERVLRSQPEAISEPSDVTAQEVLPRLDALGRSVERLTEVVQRRPAGSEAVPGWLEAAAGNPHVYDAPDSDRKGVCARILPATYAQLQQAKRRMGIRTIAGAWEFLLRLGLAAAERLPTRSRAADVDAGSKFSSASGNRPAR